MSSIFEEQEIVHDLSYSIINNNPSVEPGAANAVIKTIPPGLLHCFSIVLPLTFIYKYLGTASGLTGVKKLSIGKVVYAENESLLAFGPVMCSELTTSPMPPVTMGHQSGGVVERIKITNPTKVDVTVRFEVLPYLISPNDDSYAGTAGKKDTAKGSAPAANANKKAKNPGGDEKIGKRVLEL